MLFPGDHQREIAGVIRDLFGAVVDFFIFHATVLHTADLAAAGNQKLLDFFHAAGRFHEDVGAVLIQRMVRFVRSRDHMQGLIPLGQRSHVKSAVLQIDLYKKQVKVEIHVVQSRIVVSQ